MLQELGEVLVEDLGAVGWSFRSVSSSISSFEWGCSRGEWQAWKHETYFLNNLDLKVSLVRLAWDWSAEAPVLCPSRYLSILLLWIRHNCL